ncbi:MAG TPA: efflux RND transporter periplasmic adaptor subunit [Candidatus Binataceae bacterium]|nr:efflux RND transporter periplasmic adaptor subunit [Candidatus Binataceae bacterium]
MPLHKALAIIVALVMLMADGCKSNEPPAPPPPAAVTVAQPLSEGIADYIDFTGNTAAIDAVKLVARVEGFLDKVHFKDGAIVKKGELLFTIQQTQYQAQLLQAEAQVAASTASLWHATTEYKRYSALLTKGAAAATEVDRWHAERDSAAASLASARAQVIIAKLNLGYTEVRAPFDGKIGRHLVDPGNLVGSAGQQTVLAEINRINPLYVYFTINENDLLRIAERNPGAGQGSLNDIVVPAYYGLVNEDGYPHPGRLDFASISVAPTTGTLQVRAIFPNDTLDVLPGLFARVRVKALEKRAALLLPGDAVSFDQQGEYVLVVDSKNVVERRSVKTGLQMGNELVIEDGLAADDWVIVDGLLQGIPGREVTPERKTLKAESTAAITAGD